MFSSGRCSKNPTWVYLASLWAKTNNRRMGGPWMRGRMASPISVNTATTTTNGNTIVTTISQSTKGIGAKRKKGFWCRLKMQLAQDRKLNLGKLRWRLSLRFSRRTYSARAVAERSHGVVTRPLPHLLARCNGLFPPLTRGRFLSVGCCSLGVIGIM
ncbi:hypothetical protein HPP92_005533 [Vanilla planifolia]|uniref:Uncharacterized protein n=1 Tax=Vanilla planifolia TaxID=51239 RepID=A0A835RMW0_VANPL|nr:hypothetical protein HPP92_005886 [Vanilla planifolia]KAG0494539.1 hypothetical protein HPP92_005533 [Vanilla planifolia]